MPEDSEIISSFYETQNCHITHACLYLYIFIKLVLFITILLQNKFYWRPIDVRTSRITSFKLEETLPLTIAFWAVLSSKPILRNSWRISPLLLSLVTILLHKQVRSDAKPWQSSQQCQR